MAITRRSGGGAGSLDQGPAARLLGCAEPVTSSRPGSCRAVIDPTETHPGLGGEASVVLLGWSVDPLRVTAEELLGGVRELGRALEGAPLRHALDCSHLRRHGGYVRFECWFLCAAAAVLPALRARSLVYARLLRRRPAGICARCGYDLRATPVRRLECGSVAVASRQG